MLSIWHKPTVAMKDQQPRRNLSLHSKLQIRLFADILFFISLKIRVGAVVFHYRMQCFPSVGNTSGSRLLQLWSACSRHKSSVQSFLRFNIGCNLSGLCSAYRSCPDPVICGCAVGSKRTIDQHSMTDSKHPIGLCKWDRTGEGPDIQVGKFLIFSKSFETESKLENSGEKLNHDANRSIEVMPLCHMQLKNVQKKIHPRSCLKIGTNMFSLWTNRRSASDRTNALKRVTVKVWNTLFWVVWRVFVLNRCMFGVACFSIHNRCRLVLRTRPSLK